MASSIVTRRAALRTLACGMTIGGLAALVFDASLPAFAEADEGADCEEFRAIVEQLGPESRRELRQNMTSLADR